MLFDFIYFFQTALDKLQKLLFHIIISNIIPIEYDCLTPLSKIFQLYHGNIGIDGGTGETHRRFRYFPFLNNY